MLCLVGFVVDMLTDDGLNLGVILKLRVEQAGVKRRMKGGGMTL